MTATSDRPDFLSEGVPNMGKTVNVKPKLCPVTRPRWGSNLGLTDRLIVGRNVTLTLMARDAIRVGCSGTQAEEPLPALCCGLL
jgi:hypothetical protein